MTTAAAQGDGKEGGRARGVERSRRSAARTRLSDALHDAPTLALEAFDQGAALIDLTNRLLA